MQENLSLKEEIKDLKENLNINKDIIASMFKDMKEKKKISYSNVLQKLTQENVSIYKQMEKISAERSKLRSELIQIKEEKSSGQEQLAQENNTLKTKLFLMEQNLNKIKSLYELNKKKSEKRNSKNSNKLSELNHLRSRSQNSTNYTKNSKKNFTNPTKTSDKSNYNMNFNKKFFGNIIEKRKFGSIDEEDNEVYILDPTKALVKLNNELIFYKESHQKFLAKIKKKQETITKYENMINKLNAENSQLRKTYKLKLMKVNNEKENILSMIVQNHINIDEQPNILNKNIKNLSLKSKTSSGMSVTTTDYNDKSSNNYNTTNTFEQLNLNNNQLKKIINKDEVIGKETTLEEFGAILKSVGLTRELFEKMSQIKGFGKLTDSIEFFYKLTLEKNKQILILEKENESLIFKNFELNKLNIDLENELKLYRNNSDNLDKNLNINNVKKILDDDSIINNNSQKTNLNIMSKLNNNTNIIKNGKDTNNSNNNINSDSASKTINNNNNPLINYKKLIEKQKEEDQLKKAEIIFNLSLEKENESSSCSKNNNNDDGELVESNNDNEENENEENENEENDDNEDDNDDENGKDNNTQFHLDSNSYGIQFKESYTENTNSNIESIMSKDFNSKDTEENQSK